MPYMLNVTCRVFASTLTTIWIDVPVFHDVISYDKLLQGFLIFELTFGFPEDEHPETPSFPSWLRFLSRIVFLVVSNTLALFNLYTVVHLVGY